MKNFQRFEETLKIHYNYDVVDNVLTDIRCSMKYFPLLQIYLFTIFTVSFLHLSFYY